MDETDAQAQLQAATTKTDDLVDRAHTALDLLKDCQGTYVAAADVTKRRMNAAIYESFIVHDDGLVEAHTTDVFTALTDKTLISKLEAEITDLTTPGGETQLRTMRSSQLSYTPRRASC